MAIDPRFNRNKRHGISVDVPVPKSGPAQTKKETPPTVKPKPAKKRPAK